MNYKTTKEIQQVFSVNIKEKNQTITYVALRCFYAEQREKELNGMPKAYDTIAKEINCNRSNVYNVLLRAKLFRENKDTQILFEAFKNKDKALIKEYYNQVKAKKIDYQRNRYLDIALNEHEPAKVVNVISRADNKKAPLTNLKLAEFLRANKVLKHKLWDVPVRNISANQWSQVRSINEKMFDLMIN